MFKLRFWPFKSDDCVDCLDVKKMASSYIEQDGDISQEMIDELTLHMADCQPCGAFVQSLRATIEGLKDLPKEKAPERLKEELRKLVNSE